MLRRVWAWVVGLCMALSFSGTVQAFDVGPFLDAVSSSPDVVYGLYLGQPYEAYQREMHKGNWECVANGFEGESLHPAAIYRCERGPKLREKLILVHDAERSTLRKIVFAFTSDSDGDTKDIADALYYNLSRLNMILVEDHYTGDKPYAEWKMGSASDNRRVRVEYSKPADGPGEAEAIVTRYLKDGR